MDFGSWIRKKPIPDPGVKKAPDPGSGSATLEGATVFFPFELGSKAVDTSRRWPNFDFKHLATVNRKDQLFPCSPRCLINCHNSFLCSGRWCPTCSSTATRRRRTRRRGRGRRPPRLPGTTQTFRLIASEKDEWREPEVVVGLYFVPDRFFISFLTFPNVT